MKRTDAIEGLLREAYSKSHEMLKDPELGSVVQHGLIISYGPPIPKPDLLLLSFQGAGDDKVVQKEWPKKLLYVGSPYKFGTNLRKLCRDTGLYPQLEKSRTIGVSRRLPSGQGNEALEEREEALLGLASPLSQMGRTTSQSDRAEGSDGFWARNFKSFRHSLG